MTDKLTDMEKEEINLLSKFYPYNTKQVEKIFVHVNKSFDKTCKVINTALTLNCNPEDAATSLLICQGHPDGWTCPNCGKGINPTVNKCDCLSGEYHVPITTS